MNMIESISVKNYKAFKEASFDIKPITVFLGENSVGKTSILQLLMLLKQTASISLFNDNTPLKMYGYYAKMGKVENLFHNKRTDVPIELSIHFSSEKLGESLAALWDNYIVSMTSIGYFFPVRSLIEWKNVHGSEKITRSSFAEYIKLVEGVMSNEKIEKFKQNLDYTVSRNNLLAAVDLQNFSEKNFMLIYDLLSSVKEKVKKEQSFIVSYTLDYTHQKFAIQQFCLRAGDSILLSIKGEGEELSVSSSLTRVSEAAAKAISNCFWRNNPLFDCFAYPYRVDSEKNQTTMSNYLLKMVELVIKEFREQFTYTKMNHVGPLRASPKRYYVLDKESYTTYLDCSDGEALVEILKNRSYVKDKANKWLSSFGFNVSVEESEDVIHHLMVTQNARDYDISDVGFGVSQILPIIVQSFLAPDNSLNIVEQPEIHLHPRMQANLANLFSDVVSSKKKRMVIETHSEYFLRRLRRLMADSEFKGLSPEDVSIYYFEPMDIGNGKDYVSAQQIEISNKGAFDLPQSLYETEVEDNIEFMKLQAK